MPGLNAIFDRVIWNCVLKSPIHSDNQNCDCSPEVALKVQFLRLVHTFCDHHEWVVLSIIFYIFLTSVTWENCYQTEWIMQKLFVVIISLTLAYVHVWETENQSLAIRKLSAVHSGISLNTVQSYALNLLEERIEKVLQSLVSEEFCINQCSLVQ